MFSAGWCATAAQETQQKPAAEALTKSTGKADKPEKPAHPAQIELLETKVRFETNGDSRKEVHALVKINSELGVRQFAQLNFDFNRSFETVEMPMVHITHANGGTSDILPSAVTDHPNPAVVNAPAYQDVRVKSVRILGLQPGDTLEYRVVRTVSHHPLAPDFWLEHSFDRSGVVTQETFELDFPSAHEPQLHINPKTPVTSTQGTGEDRQTYRWHRVFAEETPAKESSVSEPDIILTSFKSWEELGERLKVLLEPGKSPAEIADKASELARAAPSSSTNSLELQAEAFYAFVSQKIRTIDLPLGSTGFRSRSPSEILSSGYATAEDKYALFAALTNSCGLAQAGLIPNLNGDTQASLPRPSVFDHLLTTIRWPSINFWLDLNLEVVPFRVIPSEFRGRTAFVVGPLVSETWRRVEDSLPFQAKQTVVLDASISADGKLTAKIQYSMRGDNELVLRVAFHHSPKERWKELAQLLSITDGFRGQVTGVNASDPYATKEPFTVEYELDQPKFVDWSKKPVRIPALLPQLGLPDPPAKPASGSATVAIELGTPLEVETKMTLHLPDGTTASAPAGISVERDYATYSSQYAVNGSTLTATRRIKFVLREVPAARAADYNAFLRAVQSDESQDFTLEKHDNTAPKTTSTAPSSTAPPKPVAPKP